MKKEVTYIVSGIEKSMAFEWIADDLDKDRFSLTFILLNSGPTELETILREKGIRVFRINYKGKSQMISAFLKTVKLLRKIRPAVVHAHLFDANIVGLLAAWICGVPKRAYTRHHSNYHLKYHPQAVKWDKFCNKLATDIVSISENVSTILKEKEGVPPEKITKIYHGFKLKDFNRPDPAQVEALRLKYNPSNKQPVIGVISRFTHWKGVQFIIPAFQKFRENYPDALLLLFNAGGDHANEINKLLNVLPAESYHAVKFESNITALYKLFTVFVHTPVDAESEAFGQTYVECLAAGVPLVATRSGIGSEILENEKNCLLVEYQNSEQIYAALVRLMTNEDLRKKISQDHLSELAPRFGLKTMIAALEKLYTREPS